MKARTGWTLAKQWWNPILNLGFSHGHWHALWPWSQDLCSSHDQQSSSLLLPGSFHPMADFPWGLFLPWLQGDISEEKQLLVHAKNKPSMEMLPGFSRNPLAYLQRDLLPIKSNFIKCSWRSSGLSLEKCMRSLAKPSSCLQLLPP